MKNILSIIFFLCIALGAGAYPNTNGSDTYFARLAQLLPDPTRAKTQELLGVAQYINTNNVKGEESWQYRDDHKNIIFRWDTKNNKLKGVEYIDNKSGDRNWSNSYIANVEMGVSSYKQVLAVLGEPQNLFFSGDMQKLRYYFADNTVEFQFKGGVLTTMHMERINRKK